MRNTEEERLRPKEHRLGRPVYGFSKLVGSPPSKYWHHSITDACTQPGAPRPPEHRGGVLADAVGVGKTLTVIGLFVWAAAELTSGISAIREQTLIIASPAALTAWEGQLEKHFRPGCPLRYHIHYGM